MKNNRTLNLSTITGALIQHVVNLTFDQSITTGEVNLERATLIEQLGLALQMDKDVSEYTFSALNTNGFCAPKYSHAFIAALVKVPESFEVDDKHYQTSTAYLRLGDADAISTLRNRKGLFAFTSEGKRERSEDPLTEKNWHHHIDHLRMIKEARRAE
ncbi:hypothetical protein [Vibrio jasicida]|uniref:hypothetical protein n=1 Tax=Vibrio jasicida TaxID=766224 RepID=UPI0021586BF0|nr:hypothetical protein [Vibrio jasicida]